MRNRREKLLALVAGLAVAILLTDAYVVQPLSEAYQQLDDRRAAALADLREARNIMRARRAAEQRWRQMVQAGLTGAAADAESQALRAMRTWADDAQLDLASMQPERRGASFAGSDDEALHEIDIAARGSGSLESVARFFYELEVAELPVRIRRVRLARSSNDDADTLSLDFRATTIHREQPAEEQP